MSAIEIDHFPVSEFELRLRRTQQAMHAAELDALFFTTEPEMRYFTGFRTMFWLSPTRPWFLVVPLSGKPIAVIPEIGAQLMRSTWIESIHTWSAPHAEDDGISLLVSVLRGFRRIGMPMGRESQLRMPLADFQQVRQSIPHTEWVDATGLVQSIRQIKSEIEIDWIRSACQAASRAFARLPELVHVGMPLDAAFATFRIELLHQGAEDVPYLVGGCGPDGYQDVISPPDQRLITEGDVLMLDTGATCGGYYCDFDRNVGFGKVSPTCHAVYRKLYEATEAALAVARPGVPVSQIHRVMADVLEQTQSDVGRFGHGLGMQLTETPSNVDFDHTVLKPGMVITLEPSLQYRDRLMVHEENIVIREGAPELLSARAPEQLPLIG